MEKCENHSPAKHGWEIPEFNGSSGKVTDFRGILTQLVEIIPPGNLTVCCGSPSPWNHSLMICCSC